VYSEKIANFLLHFLGNHINPMSPCNKVFALRAIIWQDYYPSMIQRIVVVNPPFLLHVIWPIVRFLLNESARKLLHFAQRKDSIFTVLDANVVPVAFGGQLKVNNGPYLASDLILGSELVES
jgi:hypothetical protein